MTRNSGQDQRQRSELDREPDLGWRYEHDGTGVVSGGGVPSS